MNSILDTFKALSDRNRLRVVAALMHVDELCACQIVELLQVSGATASQHMRLLIQAGLVESRKDGRWVYYWLNRKGPASAGLFQWLESSLAGDVELKKDRTLIKRIAAGDPEDLCRKQRGDACCPKPKPTRRSS